MQGYVRADVGEHPVLGPLKAGTVMEVPEALWSDALWAPIGPGGLPVVGESLGDPDADLAQAEAEQARLAAAQIESARVAKESEAAAARIEEGRSISRRIRALAQRMATDRQETEQRQAGYQEELGRLMLEAAEYSRRLVAAIASEPTPPAEG